MEAGVWTVGLRLQHLPDHSEQCEEALEVGISYPGGCSWRWWEDHEVLRRGDSASADGSLGRSEVCLLHGD